jgi:hypothetical protein
MSTISGHTKIFYRKISQGFFHVPNDDGERQNTVLLCFELQNTILVERSVDYDLVVNKTVSPTARKNLTIYSPSTIFKNNSNR